MDALPGMLRELALYGLVILAFLGPIEASCASVSGKRHTEVTRAAIWPWPIPG